MDNTRRLEDMVDAKQKIGVSPAAALYSTVEYLLDRILSLSKKIGGNITGVYPVEPQVMKKPFTEHYTAIDGIIYRMGLDPNADLMDPKESYMIPVTKEQFLRWVQQEPERIRDVYRHMVDYLAELPGYLDTTAKTNTPEFEEVRNRIF